MFLPVRLTDDLSNKYATSSIGIIDCAIKRIFVTYLGEDQYDRCKLINNLALIIDKIGDEEYTSSRKRIMNSLIQILSREGEEVIAEELMGKFYDFSKIHQDTYIYKEPDCKKYATLETLHMRRQYPLSRQNNLLIALYAYLPALRGQDYNNTKVVQLPSDVNIKDKYKELGFNFLDLTSLNLVLGAYKTVKSYGIRVIKLPEMMKEIIVDSIGDRMGDYIFSNSNGSHYSDTGFSHFISGMFDYQIGVKLGIDDLRKVYISEVLSYLNRQGFNISEQKYYRTKISQIQAHCLSTQEFLYSGHKFNSELPKSSDGYMKMILGIIDEMEVSFYKS